MFILRLEDLLKNFTLVGLLFGISISIFFSSPTSAAPNWTAEGVDPAVKAIDQREPSKRCIDKAITLGPGLNDSGTACMLRAQHLEYGILKRCLPQWWGGCYMQEDNVVKFPNDTYANLVRNISFSTSYFSAAKDDIVYTGFDGSGLYIVRDVAKKLQRTINISTQKVEYELPDSAEHEILVPKSQGGSIKAYHYALSKNGKWLVIFAEKIGSIRVNLETGEKVLFSNYAPMSGYGFDPIPYYTVSNDGTQVILQGVNVPFVAFNIDNRCGVRADSFVEEYGYYQNAEYCTTKNLSGFVPNYNMTLHSEFDAQEGSMVFANYGNGEWYKMTLPGYETYQLDYLAMGDSFSSGEGDNDDSYYEKGTNDKYEDCHLSRRSYPYLLANRIGINDTYFKSVACSGATTTDIVFDDIKKDYGGQGGRLEKPDKMNLSSETAGIYKDESKQKFTPGRVPQAYFAEKYQPKIVTIGIGGNDIKLVDKVISCMLPGECFWVDDSQKPKLAVEIRDKFNELVHTYDLIRSRSSNSQVYAISYPDVIDPTGVCDPSIRQTITQNEKRMIFESLRYLNQVIAAAAQKAGVKYVSTEGSFGNTALCGSSDQRAMNAIKIKGGWSITNITPDIAFANESVHSNEFGHNLIANRINQEVPNIKVYDYCNGAPRCRNDSIKAPEPTAPFWNYSSNQTHPKLIGKDFIQSSPEKKINVHIDSYELYPDSAINGVAHSEPIDLGSYTTNSDGGLDAQIDLPDNLESGYHTIVLKGKSYSSEDIEIYQTVFITEDRTVVSVSDAQNVKTATTPSSYNSTVNRNSGEKDTDTASVKPNINKGTSEENQKSHTGQVTLPSIAGLGNIANIFPDISSTKNDTTENTAKTAALVVLAFAGFLSLIYFLGRLRNKR